MDNGGNMRMHRVPAIHGRRRSAIFHQLKKIRCGIRAKLSPKFDLVPISDTGTRGKFLRASEKDFILKKPRDLE